jgi:AmmeMemoRadiSam system protein B
LAAPHIDFARGGQIYAAAYGELARRRPPDVVVALGVAHHSPRSPWVTTRKAYETPFGPMMVDADLHDRIAARLWYDTREEEWVHAKEHSLEFQALWLKYLWRDKTPPWVPILCSSFEPYCEDRPPSVVPTVEKALSDIGDLLAEERRKGRRVMILAGVDLAHVGRRFGDEMDVDDALKKKVETLDRESLDKALAGDADGFFLAGVGENAWRKVCGLSALYTALRWTRAVAGGPLSGMLLGYDQKPDPAGGIVSFAGAVFDPA